MNEYLDSSRFIDWKQPLLRAKAAELAAGCVSDEAIAKRCFEFVRDGIKHSWDYRLNPVTCKASDVLIHGTGYCYAKSHLLAALLRANQIPAGLCYQRLRGLGSNGTVNRLKDFRKCREEDAIHPGQRNHQQQKSTGPAS